MGNIAWPGGVAPAVETEKYWPCRTLHKPMSPGKNVTFLSHFEGGIGQCSPQENIAQGEHFSKLPEKNGSLMTFLLGGRGLFKTVTWCVPNRF